MHIQLNGSSKELPDNSSIAELIDLLELAGQRYAVEVNETLVPRSQHTEYRLSVGDAVEIVQAIGGG